MHGLLYVVGYPGYETVIVVFITLSDIISDIIFLIR